MNGNLIKKELFPSVLISILIHAVIIIYLSHQYLNTSHKPLNKKVNVKPIKSFLYIPTQKTKAHKADISPNTSHIFQEKRMTKKVSSLKYIKKTGERKITKSTVSNTHSKEKLIDNKQITESVTRSITIQTLQDQIKNINKDISYQYKAPKKKSSIKSVFNSAPTLVKRSTTISPELEEQKRKENITNYGSNVSIQKDDEGNCSITQDLSSVGIEGISATQHFNCGGKTKFEKAFSHHMKETMKKHKQ